MAHTTGIIFRTTGPGRVGKGSNLTPEEVDENFQDVDERVFDLELNPPVPVEISNITVTGSTMTIHMADGSKFGPFTLPTATFVFRGTWAPLTQYFVNDVFYEPSEGVYLVITDFESATAFDPDGAEVSRMLPDAGRWHSGAGVPPSVLGGEGDMYLDTATSDVYEHQGTTGWVLVDNILSPPATLDGVGDVEYTTAGPAEGDALVRRGSVWVHEPGTGRMTLWVPAAAMQPTVTAGAGSHLTDSGLATVELTAGQPNITYLPFAPDVEQNAQWSFTMPKSWNLGALKFQTIHSHDGGQTAGLDGVVWGLSAVAVGDGESVDVAFGSEVEVAKDASAADAEHKSAESAALTPAGTIAAGDTIYFNLARKVGEAADDLETDARHHGVVLFYDTKALTDD